MVNADGSAPWRIADDGAFPAWSPDGTRIAYSGGWFPYANGTASNWIWVVGADGSAPSKMTGDGVFSFAPRWSPDGSRIAYLVARDERWSPVYLYVMHADGSGQTRLARADSKGFDWSPDGTQLVFVQPTRPDATATTSQLMVVGVGGGAAVPLTAASGWVSGPRWSHDGTQIAFVRSASNETGSAGRLYVINTDGSGERVVASGLEYYAEVAWITVGAVASLIYTRPGPAIYRLAGDGPARVVDGSDPDVSTR